jgi:hypothetical protein
VAQDSFMLFQCIFASLCTDFLKLVTTEALHYHIVDTKAPQEPPIPCGALLLKIIIMKAHVDIRATVSFICTALSSLDTKMMALDSDISKFKAYVKTQVIALEARGETATDLLATPKKNKRAPKDPSKAKQDKDQKWAWKKVLPKEGEHVTKVVDGKNYHLACEHHPNQWVCHTTAECSKNSANNGVPKDAQAKQRLKKARMAAAALLAEDDEEEESNEDPDSY